MKAAKQISMRFAVDIQKMVSCLVRELILLR